MKEPRQVIVVIAPKFQQAKHFAQSIKGWSNLEWRYAREPHHLAGLMNIVLYDVRAPRYEMSPREKEWMEALELQISAYERIGRIVKRNDVNLL